ncbi:hypothetical protein ACFP1I_25520 [Dyadobacter subterraneus]|uniref:Uncharacterized protein n=1 Tax=Dyadobacter subterraneus TaxID=2773304 RepID=A0ABR9WK32_9BACT|nr:hypothetical protein [Dyadobacter subterraneus]MBE9465862.1 hypothetical protein [Dyadobacter subterraneus]
MKSTLYFSKIFGFTFIFLSILASFSKAQNVRKNDVIITRTNEKIEAIIQEVDAGKVKYKKASDPDGPVFTLDKKEISSILYGNGEVEKLDNATDEYFAPDKTPPPVIYNKEPERSYNTRSGNDLEKLKSDFRLYAKKSTKYRTMGLIGISAGVIFTTAGVLLVSGSSSYYNSNGTLVYDTDASVGSLLIIAGIGAGIPLTIIGFINQKRYKKKVINVRDELRRRNEPISLRLKPGFNPVTQTGYLSLKMNF